MVSGIHVQLAVSNADSCPASAISEGVEIDSLRVDHHATPTTTEVVGELTIDRSDDIETKPEAVAEVFSDDTKSVYRYTHDDSCPCQFVPTHGCPVRSLRADSGQLIVSFIAPNLDTVRDVVTDLRSCSESVAVNRLTRSAPTEEQSLLFVDRTAFTDRQYEALETAHEMGYFASPKGATAEEVATELGISVATFLEHLSVAQTKLLDQILAT